ncbi:TetR/AcrR family transcriptional regulator [Undibacterium sp. MH2W]|uniref:TetR/AcrR family transcriptional regulator n=1 Tax=Undibacterium sp. MH2W TaxID=3413044 RepID=UPI003BEFF385
MTTHMQPPNTRGPLDHSVREQIVLAATEHFAHYGFEKTTVSDLAKSIGFSKAYIYKFFDSKQAIGEVICSNRLALMTEHVTVKVTSAPSATEKIRRLFSALVEAGSDLFFHDRKLYDIAAVASRDRWPSTQLYEQQLQKMLEDILIQGRQDGEFERKTPLDELVNAVYMVMRPYVMPVQLQYNLDIANSSAVQLSALILRSLSP